MSSCDAVRSYAEGLRTENGPIGAKSVVNCGQTSNASVFSRVKNAARAEVNNLHAASEGQGEKLGADQPPTWTG